MNIIHETVLRLVEQGRTPEEIVKEAADPASPLHSCFEWDDSVAAHRWRVEQARHLIARVKVDIQTSPDTSVRVRAITHVDSLGEYMPTETALKEHRDVVFQQCLRDIEALRRKYQTLVDVDAVWAEAKKGRRKAA